MSIKINETVSKDISAILRDLAKIPAEAHKEFVALTPIDKGGARRKTTRQGNTITADYDYAQRLDTGWSKQAPKGMVEPWSKWVEKRMNQALEK